jgi:hypothetical protein
VISGPPAPDPELEISRRIWCEGNGHVITRQVTLNNGMTRREHPLLTVTVCKTCGWRIS